MVMRAPAVDAVGLEERAASLATRSIKRDAKLWALDLAIRCTDLTTLEGSDTIGKVVAMCSKAVRPDPLDPAVPSVAAVCIYPWLVPTAVTHLAGSGVRVASVAGAFPAGLGPLEARLQEIRDVVAMGADEVDIVLNRSLFLGGRYQQAFEELAAARDAAGTRPSQGDPGDRRARIVRPGPSSERAGDGGRRRLHQDVDREDRRERDPPDGALHVRGRARLPSGHRSRGRDQGRRRRPQGEGRDPVPGRACTRRSVRTG